MKKQNMLVLLASTVVILIFVAFLFFNLEFIPCQLQCQDQQPTTDCTAPGCAGSSMACMDECTGVVGSTTTPHCFTYGNQDFCAGNRFNLLLIRFGLLLSPSVNPNLV